MIGREPMIIDEVAPLAFVEPARPEPVLPGESPRRRNDRLLMAVSVMVLIITLFTLVRAVGFRGDTPVFATPRESVTWTMSQAWVDTGKPVVREPGLEELPDGLGIALTPRDGAAAGDELLPKEFPLTVAAYALALRVNGVIAYSLNPIQGILLLLSIAWLGRELGGSWKAGALGGLAMLTTLAFWSSGSTPVAADTIGVAAVLGATAMLLRDWRRHDLATDVAAGLGAGLLVAVAVASRYTLLGPGLVIIALLPILGSVSKKKGLAAAAGVVIGLLPILAYHQWVYGGVTTTGYAIGDRLFQEQIGLESGSLVSFDLHDFWNHARFYLLTPTALGLYFVALVGMYRFRGRPNIRAVQVCLGIMIVALVGFHGGQATWGSQEFVVNASLLRYLLVVFAFLSVFGGLALSKLSGQIATAAIALVLLGITSAVWTANDGPAGFLSNSRLIENQARTRDEVVGVVPPDAIIVSRLGSKTFFPERRVISASLLRAGEISDLGPGQSVWELVPSPSQLAASLVALREAGYDVFVHNDGNEPWLRDQDLEELAQRLQTDGLGLTDRSTTNEALFEVSDRAEIE